MVFCPVDAGADPITRGPIPLDSTGWHVRSPIHYRGPSCHRPPRAATASTRPRSPIGRGNGFKTRTGVSSTLTGGTRFAQVNAVSWVRVWRRIHLTV